MQRAKFGDEGGGRAAGRRSRGSLQVQCNFLFPSSYLLLPSHLSPLSKLEPGSLSLSLSLLTVLRTIIALRTAQRVRGGLLLHASPVFFVERIRCLGTTTVRMGDPLQKDHPPLENNIRLQDALEESSI